MKLLKVSAKNNEKFIESVNKDKPILILYFASWCPHCQMLEPTWNKLCNKYKKNRKIQFAEVEYDNMIHIPKKYNKNIVGFPTMHMIKGGKIIAEYNDTRDLEELSKFVEKYI